MKFYNICIDVICRYNARYRWRKAIREVRIMNKVMDSFPTSY